MKGILLSLFFLSTLLFACRKAKVEEPANESIVSKWTLDSVFSKAKYVTASQGDTTIYNSGAYNDQDDQMDFRTDSVMYGYYREASIERDTVKYSYKPYVLTYIKKNKTTQVDDTIYFQVSFPEKGKKMILYNKQQITDVTGYAIYETRLFLHR